jgi:hypothetical protein
MTCARVRAGVAGIGAGVIGLACGPAAGWCVPVFIGAAGGAELSVQTQLVEHPDKPIDRGAVLWDAFLGGAIFGGGGEGLLSFKKWLAAAG